MIFSKYECQIKIHMGKAGQIGVETSESGISQRAIVGKAE
jgi:hypothetical protein